MQDPDTIRHLIEQNPMLKNMVKDNPAMKTILENPQLMKSLMSNFLINLDPQNLKWPDK